MKQRQVKPIRVRPSFRYEWPVILEIIFYALLIWEMWTLWSRPMVEDFPRIQTLAVLMGFEFLLVHSALFINVMPRKVSVLVLLPVYGIVALSLNMGAENNLILFLYLGVIITRLRFLFAHYSAVQKSRALKVSIVSALIYLSAIAVIAMGEGGLPRGDSRLNFWPMEII